MIYTHMISVIIPVYNVENYVSKCIESIINQTYKNLEIIIVNDGSTDKSGNICENYAKKDDRIILIHQENQGLSMARNNALDIASGDYIGFVDSDDWIASDMYYSLYNDAVTHDADISICNFYYVQNGHTLKYNNTNEDIKVLEGINKMAYYINYNDYVWNRLYKRYLFVGIRFPKGKIFEDIFIMYKLIDKANKVVWSSECKYYYLLRENSITSSSFNLNQIDSVEAYIEKYNYISSEYQNLERLCRKGIFLKLLWVINRAYRDNKINLYKEALMKIINKLKLYDFKNCGLSIEQEDILELLFEDIKKYIVGMRLLSKQNKVIEIGENNSDIGENSEEVNWFVENKSLIKNPAVSVIIPVYNVEPYLRQCLDSIISQTLINIEIICINDGSSDNSFEILKEYEKKDNRIIIISRENKGVAFSRNEGIQIAKGEFIAFMDSDDWYPSKLTLIELYSCAKKNNALICGGSLSLYVNERTIYGSQKTIFNKKGFIEYKNYQSSHFFQRFIYNRDMLLTKNIFFPLYSHYEDPPFMIKAMIAANKFYAIKSVVYRYRYNYKGVNFTKTRIADILKGLNDCLILSSENNLSKLHIFTANSLFNNYYPFSTSLLLDNGDLHKLLFKLLLSVDYKIINENFTTRTLNFFGQNDEKYLNYMERDKSDFILIFNAYMKSLSDRNIYSSVKEDFISLVLKEKNNNFICKKDEDFLQLYKLIK